MLPFRFFGKLSFLCGSCWIKENLLRKQVENLFIKRKESKTLFFYYAFNSIFNSIALTEIIWYRKVCRRHHRDRVRYSRFRLILYPPLQDKFLRQGER